MKEDATVTITVEELAEYIRNSVTLDTIREMVFATAYLSYDGESLRNATADVMSMFRYLEPNHYKRELFFKQAEKESEAEK